MPTKLWVAVVSVLLLGVGAGVAVATASPHLSSSGPTAVKGTEATALFSLGSRTIRQVRYADKKTLGYTFTLKNDGWLPVKVTGLVKPERQPRLFSYLGVTDSAGDTEFSVSAHGSRPVTVNFLMRGCETLSARAGSVVSQVTLVTRSRGSGTSEVTVPFPEEVRSGSPREIACVNATASSRPPG